MTETATDLALTLKLKEMELVGTSLSQLRSTLSTLFTLELGLNALLVASALQRKISTAALLLSILATIIFLGMAATSLLPRSGYLSWPDGKQLIILGAGSAVDAKRTMVNELADKINIAQDGVKKTLILGAASAVGGALVITLWAYQVSRFTFPTRP